MRTTLTANDLDELRSLLVANHPTDMADVIDRLADTNQERVFRHYATGSNATHS